MVLVDMIIDYIAEHSGEEATKEYPRMVGKLNAPVGLIGFKRAEPGTPVFERTDRYLIIMETLDGKSSLELTYYKETLKPVIDFNTALGSIPEVHKKST